MSNPAADQDFEPDSAEEETPQPYIKMVQLLKDGPILVHGAVSFIRKDEGEAYGPDAAPIALCRCGYSLNKPFCEGSHTVGAELPEGEIE